jgi:hypothetical protein
MEVQGQGRAARLRRGPAGAAGALHPVLRQLLGPSGTYCSIKHTTPRRAPTPNGARTSPASPGTLIHLLPTVPFHGSGAVVQPQELVPAAGGGEGGVHPRQRGRPRARAAQDHPPQSPGAVRAGRRAGPAGGGGRGRVPPARGPPGRRAPEPARRAGARAGRRRRRRLPRRGVEAPQPGVQVPAGQGAGRRRVPRVRAAARERRPGRRAACGSVILARQITVGPVAGPGPRCNEM